MKRFFEFKFVIHLSLIVLVTTILSSCAFSALDLVSEKPVPAEIIWPHSSKTIERALKPAQIAFRESDTSSIMKKVDRLSIDNFSEITIGNSLISDFDVSRDGLTVFAGERSGKILQIKLVPRNLRTILTPKTRGEFVAKVRELALSKKPILALNLSPDQRLLAVAQDSSIYVIDLQKNSIDYQLTKIKGRVAKISWDALGTMIGIGLASGQVITWNITAGKAAGENNLNAVNYYSDALSPIIGLSFHPSGRSLFVGERDGEVAMWRLLRAEWILGLRDDNAVSDKDQKANAVKRFAALGVRINDTLLNSDGSFLYVGTSNGIVSEWKVRGLKNEANVQLSNDDVLSLAEVDLSPGISADEERQSIIFASSRMQRVALLCASKNKKQLKTVGFTDRFDYPLGLIKSGKDSTLLWGIGKTGKLLVFDARVLRSNKQKFSRISACFN